MMLAALAILLFVGNLAAAAIFGDHPQWVDTLTTVLFLPLLCGLLLAVARDFNRL